MCIAPEEPFRQLLQSVRSFAQALNSLARFKSSAPSAGLRVRTPVYSAAHEINPYRSQCAVPRSRERLTLEWPSFGCCQDHTRGKSSREPTAGPLGRLSKPKSGSWTSTVGWQSFTLAGRARHFGRRQWYVVCPVTRKHVRVSEPRSTPRFALSNQGREDASRHF
jgi:hypothetical protein